MKILALVYATIVFSWMATPLIAKSEITDGLPQGSISGRIIDKTNGAPMEYVSIALYSEIDSSLITGTITDPQGIFSIRKVEDGKYYVKVCFVGYSGLVIPNLHVKSRNAKIELGEISLKAEYIEIDEVTVKGERSMIEYKIDKRVINVDKDITAKGGTAVNVLENTPSVQVDPQGNLTLRGSSDYIVLIDGKPSVIKGSDLLKQIPSASIQQIEVITNPSARYEADGQAGIINVIMKKDRLNGVSGNLNLTKGNTEKESGNLLLNYRKAKVNVFTGIDYTNNIYRDIIKINTNSFLSTDTVRVNGLTREFYKNNNLSAKTGVDLNINEKNSLSLSGSIGRQGYDNGSNSTSIVSPGELVTNQYYKSFIYRDITGDVYDLNMDFTHKFSNEKKLSVSNVLSIWDGSDENLVKEYFTDPSFHEEIISSMALDTKDNRNQTCRLNIDYSQPLWAGAFEAGSQFRKETRKEEYILYKYSLPDEIMIENENSSYLQNYSNDIYSGYSTYSNVFKGIGYKIGLRSEYFVRSNSFNNEQNSFNYKKFMFYPSVHFSKTWKDIHHFQLSYSRRINRPQSYLLNTTPRYVDTRNIFIGSPMLIPEFTDAFELNYRAGFKKINLWSQTYFRSTSNTFMAIRYLGENGVIYHQLTNANNQTASGIELGSDLKVMEWWKLSTNINIYDYQINTNVSNVDKTQRILTWDTRIVQNFSFKKGTRFQATFYYRAAGVDAMGKTSGFYVLNLGAYQSFLNGKLNLSISGQNILPNGFTYKVKTTEFDNQYYVEQEGQIFLVNLTYNINNFKSRQRGRSDDTQFKGGGTF